MNFDDQRTVRILVISLLIFFLIITFIVPCHGWHKTLTFIQQSSYESNSYNQNHKIISNMKFFMWYNTYAIYGTREMLILLKPDSNNSIIEIFSYNWPIDQITMDECLQEWNTKDKCYNDVVHVRILSDNTKMNVYCTYAHRPMVRTFDLQSMSFINEHILIRDPHPPMDSESSYVMLNFNTNIITAGYQGDYIPTIRATQGKTLLYALRQNSYFIGGFKYDGKAVFGVIETSERIETNRVSRLVMACSNRTEIVRKAILNCSTDMFDQSRSFVFHILTALVDPIHMSNGSTLLFATFTTNNSSITASAVCLFMLDKQFYHVFTAPSKQTNRRTLIINNELNDLIKNCSQTISSTIHRDMVESERQFQSYLSNPLLMETMSPHIFTAINVIQYDIDHYCLIIGTSNGRLLTAFTDRTFKTNVFEELTLPINMRYSIKSIAYQKTDDNSYVIIITNHLGYLVIKLIQCNEKLCFVCWTKDCLIRKKLPMDTMVRHHCSSADSIRSISINDTEIDINNYSLPNDWSLSSPVSDEQFNNKLLLFYIITPMSLVVFILSVSIIILLTKTNHKQKQIHYKHHPKTKYLSSIIPRTDSNTYTDDILYKTNNKKLFVEKKNSLNLFPIKSELSIRSTPYPIYSSSSYSLPSLVLSSPSPPPPFIPPATPQFLSVHRLYKSYV
ncbi:unnamed protein product [Rotaria sordida]|uniref:Sema domain-containing protein n=1 Tax=Rotaria sordida TaxID=392033 RepID=A0A818X7M0_9BILA|nr:unnamed protein product [Rotaria sordida]CAF1189429.1 unnamed protein product [Rotaria sordida]CAF3615836.1 unnamed protein product [Rotaria sordida]CAF3735171.1 unnamed protein product [Rotaria sordida]